ncbi:MAG: death domain-associated protein [Halobacteriales archaeon SW_9_67_25]|jgi:hypothetical protein|nr:MAG: death domain-associated protein [Halobacteriales archaeon SW_9_67_25]
MGFGSYDESEQENQQVDTDDDSEAVSLDEAKHEGEVTFETDADTEALVGKLAEMKDDGDGE